MNYQKIHDAIIDRARNRKLECYTERHHIVPKCMGGDNSEGNIVDLTAKEHYLVHQLLVKIYPDNFKLVYAANMMALCDPTNGGYRVNLKQYEWLRIRWAEAASTHSKENIWGNPEVRERMLSAKKKLYESPEYGENMSKVKKEFYKNNPEALKALKSYAGVYFKDPENKEKHRQIMRKILDSPGHREKMSKAQAKVWESEEFRAKRAATVRKNNKWDEMIAIIQPLLDKGYSMIRIVKETDLTHGQVKRCIYRFNLPRTKFQHKSKNCAYKV